MSPMNGRANERQIRSLKMQNAEIQNCFHFNIHLKMLMSTAPLIRCIVVFVSFFFLDLFGIGTRWKYEFNSVDELCLAKNTDKHFIYVKSFRSQENYIFNGNFRQQLSILCQLIARYPLKICFRMNFVHSTRWYFVYIACIKVSTRRKWC